MPVTWSFHDIQTSSFDALSSPLSSLHIVFCSMNILADSLNFLLIFSLWVFVPIPKISLCQLATLSFVGSVLSLGDYTHAPALLPVSQCG